MSFRVMSFNIRGSFHPQDGENVWERRAALNVETIKRHAPDLIGFQELQSGNLSTYQADLAGYQYVLGNDASDHSEYRSIFWKPSVFELLESGAFWLSETPEVYSESWNTDCVRAATWVRLREKATGASFLHLNTHLDHRSEWARREGCRLLVRRISDLRGDDLPVILTGDFNCNAHQAVALADANYRYLIDGGFVDSYLAGGGSDSARSNTFHDFQGDRFNLNGDEGFSGRIDWMLTLDGVRRWRVRSSGIIRDHADPVYPSDHYPIFADFELV